MLARFCISAVILGSMIPLSRGQSTPDGREMLAAISQKYASLDSYHAEGHLVVVRDPDCTLAFPFELLGGSAAPESLKSSSKSMKPSAACLAEFGKLGSLAIPNSWSIFDAIDVGLVGVLELPRETLHLPAKDIPCRVLEVSYDSYQGMMRNIVGPVRFWVETATNLVWRADFVGSYEGKSLRWSARIEKMTAAEDREPTRRANAARFPLIGKPAPDLQLRDAYGEMVHLAGFRGKAVALDFWATWCEGCDLELPFLEKIQDRAASSQLVLLGVTEEKASDVREWLEKYHRHFQSLVDAGTARQTFNVPFIPSLVLIDKQGIVRDYLTGFQSQNGIRERLKEIESPAAISNN